MSATGFLTKLVREELGGNFDRLGIRVLESLAETGRVQLERLENVTTALGVLTEKSEKAQESRLTVEGRLDAIRQDNAVKLDEMRQTVDEKLQGTRRKSEFRCHHTHLAQTNAVKLGRGIKRSLVFYAGAPDVYPHKLCRRD